MTFNIIDENMIFAYNNMDKVAINKDKLDELCDKIPKDKLTQHWSTKSPVNYETYSSEDKLAFLFAFNSISFNYWSPAYLPQWHVEPQVEEVDLRRGTWNLLYALDKAVYSKELELTPSFLENLTMQRLNKILKGNIIIPLLEERKDILNEIGYVISEHDSFEKYVSKSDSAIDLVERLANDFPSFNDTHQYKGRELKFHKRAQVLTADINKFYKPLKDMDKLTACADYKLPQYFRWNKVLSYDMSTEHLIQRKIPLCDETKGVIETRVATIMLVNEMSKRLPATQMEINDYIWLESGRIPANFQYMRVQTTAF